jgi:formylglycine-generating enzyme required for sulfatase activity
MSDEPRRIVVEAPASASAKEGDTARRALAPTAPDPAPTVVAAALVAILLLTAATLALLNAQTQKAKIGTQPPVAASAPTLGPACPEGMVSIGGAGPVRAFCIDRTEVTVEAYRPCADAQVCPPAGQRTEGSAIAQAERDVIDPLCTARAPEARAKHPLNCASWDMATAFCKARGKRLPTEAEWVRAAFGAAGAQGAAPTGPWGAAPPSAKLLNACGAECVDWGKKSGVDVRALYEGSDGFPTTAPVGSFPDGASPNGVLDLFGNVAEWTDDAADAADTRVVRGGGWQMSSLDPAATRSVESASRRSVGIGFRCAATRR